MEEKRKKQMGEEDDLTPNPNQVKKDGSLGDAKIRRLERSVDADGFLEDPAEKTGDQESRDT